MRRLILNTLLNFLTFPIRILKDVDDPIGVRTTGSIHMKKEYDFIVVGGGSAGCVVAARLAETGLDVLLLEAGEDETYISEIPGALGLTVGSDMDWNYLTNPDGKSCLGMKKNQCVWHAGKVLGGGSTINGMQYVRGDREDYDAWERAGNEGWGWEQVLPYFKKSQHQLNRQLARNTRVHSTEGPLPVSDVTFKTPLSDTFLKSAEDAGYAVKDLNTGDSTGFAFMQATIKDGKRFSTAKAFLRPVKDKPNLTIITKAFVEKIGISDDSGEYVADKVIFTRLGTKYTVCSRKEIVISAGVVGSPKILMLSGIGPKYHLESLGIRNKVDLPVGQNMQSHVGIGEIVFTLNKPVSFNPARLFSNPFNILAYLRGEGPLASVSGFEGMGIYRSGLDPTTTWPDVQLYLLSATPGIDGGLVYRDSVNMDDQMFSKWRPLTLREGFTILPVIVHPKSRGTVKLKSRDPKAAPLINANYFDDPLDMKVMIQAIKLSLKLGTSKFFRKFGSKFYDKPLEFCREFVQYSDEYWDCAARYFTYPLYHDAGTCKMGTPTDPQSVVDRRLSVYGVTGLRVADASIMPNLVSGNTNAPCIMIGEKASDLIKEDWGLL